MVLHSQRRHSASLRRRISTGRASRRAGSRSSLGAALRRGLEQPPPRDRPYGGSPSSVTLYDVSSGSRHAPSPARKETRKDSCRATLGDFSVSPSGAHVLFASPCLSHAAALATDLFGGTTYDYPSVTAPNAVAWSPDGQYVAIGAAGMTAAPAQPSRCSRRRVTSRRVGWSVGAAPHDLAFSPDGMHVFAIVGLQRRLRLPGSRPHTRLRTLRSRAALPRPRPRTRPGRRSRSRRMPHR